MNSKTKEIVLYAAWLCVYILWVGLGTVDTVEGVGKIFFILTALIFFIPGILLLVTGKKENNRKMTLRVRMVSICSLTLTVILFCFNVAAAATGKANSFLHDLLNLVSAPMFCAQYWVLSLFGWASLLWGSIIKKK